jgi:hypothetical protein
MYPPSQISDAERQKRNAAEWPWILIAWYAILAIFHFASGHPVGGVLWTWAVLINLASQIMERRNVPARQRRLMVLGAIIVPLIALLAFRSRL